MLKLSNKVISSIVGIAIAGGAITATAATAQPKSAVSSAAPVSSTVSSAVVSSAAPVSSATTVSSQTEVSNVEDGVKKIQEATDNGVSKIHEETNKAIKQVQDNSPKTVSHKLTAVGEIIISPKAEPSVNGAPTRAPQKADLKVLQSYFPENESEKFIAFGYCGHFGDNSDLETVSGLKKMGFKLLDANGKSLDFTDYKGWMWIKVPYTNFSDVSTLYLTYQDQKITITIS